MRHLNKIVTLVLLLFLIGSQSSAQIKDAPPNIVAALIVKAIGFEKNIMNGGDIYIYILDAPDVAAELKKGIGMSIGKSTLKGVESGKMLPNQKPSVIYFDDASRLNTVVKYTSENKVLSATGHPDLIEKGITLGFGIGEDNKPKILLNLNASVREGLNWNPALLKIAKTVKSNNP